MVPVAMAHETETETPTRYSGRKFTTKELTLVREVVESCWGLSPTELARTVCELIGWKRPSGELKAQECREFSGAARVGGRAGSAREREGAATGIANRGAGGEC